MSLYRVPRGEQAMEAYRILVANGFAVPEPKINESNEMPSVVRWLKKCFESGVDVNARNRHGLTILHVLLSNCMFPNFADIIEFLCNKGADVNAVDLHFQRNALMWLLCNRFVNGMCPTHPRSFHVGESAAVKLVKRGTDVNHLDYERRNVLCYITDFDRFNYVAQNVRLIEILFDKGINFNVPHPTRDYICAYPLQTIFLEAPLIMPIAKKHGKRLMFVNKILRFYLKRDIDINSNVDGLGNNLLTYILFNARDIGGWFDIACNLIEDGINLNHRNSAGSNALYLLCTGCRLYGDKTLKMIDLLIHLGIEIDLGQGDKHALSTRWGLRDENRLIILRHLIVKHKLAIHVPVGKYLQDLAGMVLHPSPKRDKPGSRRTLVRSSLLRRAENSLYDIIQTLLTSAKDCLFDEMESINQVMRQICAWYDGENILQIIRLLCDFGANVNALCDGNESIYRFPRGFIPSFTNYTCMELIRSNFNKTCSEEEALQLFLQYGFHQNH